MIYEKIAAIWHPITKGQLISKCPLSLNRPKTNENFERISALASKKRSNQKNKDTLCR